MVIFLISRLLESIFMLLSSPASCNHIGIFAAIRRLLTQLIHNQSGLIYLSAKTDTVNGILRTLTQNTVKLFTFLSHLSITQVQCIPLYCMTGI